VYHAEKMISGGMTYHKACFTCRVCKVHLDSLNANNKEGELYCKKCYGRTFGPRGYGFGMGAGTLSMTMTALQDPNLDGVLHRPAGNLLYQATDSAQWYGQEENPLNRRYVKAAAHDHLITSNVSKYGAAHAYPRLLDEQITTEKRRFNHTIVANLPPNVVSITPAVAPTAAHRQQQPRVNRDDFEADQDMYAKMRERQDDLRRRGLLDEPEAFLVPAKTIQRQY
jgi:hypothetical protein